MLVVACWGSLKWARRGFEVKVSRSDWLKELRRPEKALDALAWLDYWSVAAPPGIVREGELPAGWGLVEVRETGLRTIVEPTLLRPLPERRAQPDDRRRNGLNYGDEWEERQRFAMMARRFSYARFDVEALAGEVVPERRAKALDIAAEATGRVTSDTRAAVNDANRRLRYAKRWTKNAQVLYHLLRIAGHDPFATVGFGWTLAPPRVWEWTEGPTYAW